MLNLKQLAQHLEKKANLKQDIYQNTSNAFNMLKKETEFIINDLRKNMSNRKRVIPLEFIDRGDFEFELKFAGDTLVFYMHSNIFDLGNQQEINRMHYIKEDIDRRFCGVIHIYNFLSDSLKYGRINDSGILIGRIFVNKDNHYCIEGMREVTMAGTSFDIDKIGATKIRSILQAAILFTVNFDLGVPPYELVQEINVLDFENTVSQTPIKTSKKMGFKFGMENKKIS